MQMNARTTVTELLSSGAFIEGSRGESLTDLMAVGNDKEWIHDLPLSKLIEKNAVIHLHNGLSLSKRGCSLTLKNDFSGSPTIEIDNSDSGFKFLSGILSQKTEKSFQMVRELRQDIAFA